MPRQEQHAAVHRQGAWLPLAPPSPGPPPYWRSTGHLWVWLWLKVSLRLWCLVCVLVVVALGVVESGLAL